MIENQYNQYLYEITSFDKKVIFKAEGNTYTSLVPSSETKLGWAVTVLDMKYVKEIYRPGHLMLKLSVSDKDRNFSISLPKLRSIFNKAEVKITVKRGEKYKQDIITHYYVMTAEPIMKPNAAYELNLEAYSADYQLTLDKYSKCYLNTPLNKLIKTSIDDLSKAEGLHFGIPFDCSIDKGLQFINYNNSGSAAVYHTPYAVQYNECFYDFVARLAQRYGELLFFENGSLHLGVDPNHVAVTHTIPTDSSTPGYKSFSEVSGPESKLREQVNGSLYDYHNTDTSQQTNAYNYDLDYAEDMYMDSLPTGDLSSSQNDWRMYMDWVGLSQKCLTFFTSFRREDKGNEEWHYHAGSAINITSAFTKLSLAWIEAGFDAKAEVTDRNDTYKKAIEALMKADKVIETEQKNGEKIRPFASFTSEENVLCTNREKVQEEYDTVVAERQKQEDIIETKNLLPNAEKAFGKMKILAEKLYNVLTEFEGKVVTRKEDITRLKNMAAVIKQQTDAQSQNKPETVLYQIIDAKKKLKDEIAIRRTNSKQADKDSIDLMFKDILSALAKFKECFIFEDEKTFSSYYDLTDFQNAIPETEGEPGKQERIGFATGIQDLYKNLINEFDNTTGSSNSTQSSLNDILKAAEALFQIDAEETRTLEKLLHLSVRITKQNLFHKFLETIEKAEKQVASQRVRLEIDTNNYDRVPLLGEVVSFCGSRYLVIKVEGQSTLDKNSLHCSETLKLELIPAILERQNDEKGNSQQDSAKEPTCQWIPPMSDCRKREKVGAMIAVVTDNVDPLAMGRLRVRFKWQQEGSTPTPWIRMATPYSSTDGAGMFFIPQEDDEVLVDFYNGNIDRPIIVGVLRNNAQNHDYASGWAKRRVIKSGTGQNIAFSEGGDYAFTDALGIFPGWASFMGAFNPDLAENLGFLNDLASGKDNGFSRYMKGNLSLKDHFNTWSIKGDTGGRKVSISSNLGTICLDALTGISISAPLGDISIAAKNINLQASNNITIESGTQIKRQRKIKEDYKDGVGEGFLDAFTDVAKGYTTLVAIDFSMLRFLVETLVPPVEGTLEIKSNRYLKLEAGSKGEAVDYSVPPLLPKGEIDVVARIKGKKEFDAHAELIAKAEDLKKLVKAIDAIPVKIKEIMSKSISNANDFAIALEEVKKFNNSCLSADIQDIATDCWGSLHEKTEADINNTADLNVFIKKITNLTAEDAINAKFAYTGDNIMAALHDLGIADNASEDDNKKNYVSAKKKEFVKYAHAAASLWQEKEKYVNVSAKRLCEAMGFVGTTELNSWKFNPSTLNLEAKKIKTDALMPLYKKLFESIYDLRVSGNGYKFPERLFTDDCIKRLSRVFILATLKETGLYVYKKEYAEEALNDEGTSLTGVTLPGDNYIAGTEWKENYNYFEDGSKENEWLYFTKGCKFMALTWEGELEAGKVRKTLGILTDLSGAADFANDATAMVWNSIIESAQIKSSTHGGRVLISDNGVSIGITKNGNIEKTNDFKLGAENWK